MSPGKVFQRLPTNVKPVTYHLCIKPDLINFTFEGDLVTQLQVSESTNIIILNCLELSLISVQVKAGSKVFDGIAEYSVEEETATLKFSELIDVGAAQLIIKYKGILNDKMNGFYRCKYTSVAGEIDKYCAVTQFAATQARRCFPCWDEPAIKAQFDITLIVDSNKVALSNMPVKEEQVIGDVKRVTFERSPIMSTYLVALVVGEFDYVEERSNDGVVVRVYAAPGHSDRGKFALHVASRTLPYYRNYFGIAYPLPKLDMVAVAEMGFSAMENWGLLTYRESRLLIDESNASAVAKQEIASVVGHEIAHQWFGNLVTLEWWTDLWLNESYATFVQYLCVSHLFPEYEIWSQFVTDTYSVALKLDSLKNSHPVEVPVGHPSEVTEIFDVISYNKGASLIRMLYRYIGEEDFKKSMNLYLKRYEYGNTRTDDLWAALEDGSGKPIRKLMSTWTKQLGFPIVTVESSSQENNTRTMVLSQRKFDFVQSDNNSVWLIPITFCNSQNPDQECHSVLMDSVSCSISVPNAMANDWVKLNHQCFGYFRTKYSESLMRGFYPAMVDRTLPPLDRVGILDDLFALVQVGESSIVQLLELIFSMKNEDNYTVWRCILIIIGKIKSLLNNTDFGHKFDRFAVNLVSPIYQKLDYERESEKDHTLTLLKTMILNSMVTYGAECVLENLKKQFEDYANGLRTLHAEVRVPIYRAVIASQGIEGLEKLLKIYRHTDLQEEKNRVCNSFSTVKDTEVVQEILKFSQSAEVSSSTAILVLCSVANSKVGRHLTWEFIKTHWNEIHQKYLGNVLLSRLVSATTDGFASKKMASEIGSFFTTHRVDEVERTIAQSLEAIDQNTAWLQRDADRIAEFLEHTA